MKLDNSSPITGLIIPGDSAPNIGLLRKHLLFFDSISLIDSTDSFLVHKGEVYDKAVEHLGVVTLEQGSKRASWKAGEWDNTVLFPKHDSYTDDFKKIVEDSFQPVKKGLIGIVETKHNKKINHVVNWHLYKSLTSLTEILEAAAPDVNTPKVLTLGDDTPRLLNGITQNSIFHTKTVLPAKSDKLDSYWHQIATRRIARFVKSQQLAHIYHALPVSIDVANSQIAREFHKIGHQEKFATEDHQAISVSLDIVDSTELVKNLDDMTWNEFMSLRKAILPQAKKLRTYLINEIEKTNATTNSSIEQYIDSMQKLKNDFEKRKEDCANEWEKLRIATVLTVGATVGGIGVTQGSNVLPFPSSIEGAIAYTLGIAAIAPAAIKAELKTYLPARRRFKNHPLHFTENLTNF